MLKLKHSYTISYYDIVNPYIMEVIISINWREKWIKKSEMLQSLYYENRGKYSIVDESIPYYSSLLDYAIYLLDDFSFYKGYGFIQHIFLDDDSFCNPFYFIVDIKERDIASYWKYLFYHNDYYGDYLWKSFCTQSFNCSLVLARLLYPDWYLLELEKILYYHKSVDDLKKIVYDTSSSMFLTSFTSGISLIIISSMPSLRVMSIIAQSLQAPDKLTYTIFSL